MTGTTRTLMGLRARNLFLVLPFAALPLAAMACGGDESVASAREVDVPVTPVRTVASTSESTPVVIRTIGGDLTPPPSYVSGDEAYKVGDYRAARTLFKAFVDNTPEDAHGHYMLGLSSWKSGDFTGAEQAFDRAIALDPTFAKSYFNKARVLLDLKRAPEALEVIAKGRAIDSTSSEVARLTARAQAESGDVAAAMATYKDLLVTNENDAWGLNNLGMLMLTSGDKQGALGSFARAAQLRPTAPVFLNNLGMALEQSGYGMAALRRYELAVQHDSSFVKAVRNSERLKKLIVTDSVLVDEVNVDDLAEKFRVTVRSWKVEVPKPTP